MTAFVRLPGTGSSRVDTPDSAGLSLTGDFDLRALFAMDDWTPLAQDALMGHWNATGAQRSWNWTLQSSGVMRLVWSATGGATVITKDSTAAVGAANGTHLWVRVTHDVDNGAAGNDVAFYTSTDPVTTDPAAVSWTQLGTTVTTAGTTSHHNSTVPIEIGNFAGGTQGSPAGELYYTELRSSIAGTIVGSPDFRDGVQTSDGGLTFVDSQANTWTVQPTARWTGVEVFSAVEAETANPITPLRSVTVGQAIEVEAANPVTPVTPREVDVGQAREREFGQTIVPVKPITVSVSTAVERELARLIIPVKTAGVVVEDVVCGIAAPMAACGVEAPSAVCRV